MIGIMIGNLILTYTSDYSTGDIVIQEKKTAQALVKARSRTLKEPAA
jgi:hypothetical protein